MIIYAILALKYAPIYCLPYLGVNIPNKQIEKE